jgi:rod shape-determining protein MreD
MPTVLQNIIRFILLVLFQVLVLDNIQFLGYINPYLYILFILALPVQTPRWFSLLLAFGLGISIGICSNTPGQHAFATVLVAFARDGIIKLFTSIEEGNNPTPSFYTFGVSAYIKYVVILVFLHNVALFFLESFSFVSGWIILTKVVLSSLVTILMILGVQSFSKK